MRSCTWPTVDVKNHAPAPNRRKPIEREGDRSTSRRTCSARNAPKNISEEPRSRMKTRSTIARPQTTSSGPRSFSARERDRAEAAPGAHEQLARVAQVGREEDDDRDLRQLRRLEGDRPDAHAEVRAVDLLADARDTREQQEPQPGQGDRVPVALEHPVVAQREDRRGERAEPDDEPLRLLPRELLVDPVEHDEPEARQQRHEREEVRVGVREGEPQHDVRGEAEPEEDPAVGQRERRQLLPRPVLLQEDRREPRGDEERRGNQGEELAVPRVHRPASSPRSMLRIRSTASSNERSSCAVTVRCAGAGSALALTPDSKRCWYSSMPPGSS